MFRESDIARIRAERSVREFMPHPQRSGPCLRSLCPLPGHTERSASFYLYPDGGYHCFGCGRGGRDVIAFAIHYWDLSWPRDFPIALERLGARRADDAPGRAWSPPALPCHLPPARALHSLPDTEDLAIYRTAAALWQDALWTPAGRAARAYLRGRGIPDALLRREGVGLSTGTLARDLRRRGLSTDRAQACGLLTANGHDTFAGRIVWWEWRHVAGIWTPVWATARLVGPTAMGHATPTYLNTRGPRFLGGLERAQGTPTVAVVEGPFDRLAILCFGDQAVFLGSHTPSERVLHDLRRLAQHAALYLIRDQDRPGRRGAWSLIYRLHLPSTARLVLVDLPTGIKDAGDLVARSDGALLYHQATHGGRLIDTARVQRLCDRCHAIVQQRRRTRGATPTR